MAEADKPWFPLHTERLLLREFREGDFEDVHTYAEQPEVARFMDWGPNARDETVTHMGLKLAEQARWPRNEVTLAVEHRADCRVIGSIRLAVSDPANATGDFGYSLNRDYWRQGYATEAARAVVDAGFRILGLHRIWAECDTANVGSFGVMEKLGMRREGEFRHGRLIKGEWRNRYLYAILVDEWISPG
jgi:RimJ/RimL family protein N-acetyltransferase